MRLNPPKRQNISSHEVCVCFSHNFVCKKCNCNFIIHNKMLETANRSVEALPTFMCSFIEPPRLALTAQYLTPPSVLSAGCVHIISQKAPYTRSILPAISFVVDPGTVFVYGMVTSVLIFFWETFFELSWT